MSEDTDKELISQYHSELTNFRRKTTAEIPPNQRKSKTYRVKPNKLEILMMVYLRYGSFDFNKEPIRSFQLISKIFRVPTTTVFSQITRFLERGEVGLVDGRVTNGVYRYDKQTSDRETGFWL